jgi:hypothetical protein
MRAVLGMVTGCMLSWSLVAVVGPAPLRVAVGLGMAGPLVAAVVTWLLITRTLAGDPALMAGRMFLSLGAKMVFFGAYVVLAIRGLGVALVPFIVSFTAYFVALHTVEALLLRRAQARLMSGGPTL